MDAAEVVVKEVQRDRVDVVLELLGVGIGLTRKPLHGHPHGEVLALHEAV